MKLIVASMDRQDKKRLSHFDFPSGANCFYDIPYLNDEDEYHRFDLIKAPKGKRKNRLIIDIHGGAYVYGIRKNNLPFASYFVDFGYDVIAVDYRHVSKKTGVGVKEQIEDLLAFLSYLENHLETHGLQDDAIFMMGDSAGGHFALLLTEIALDAALQKEWGVKLNLPIKGLLVNCPVYDFAAATGVDSMTKRGKRTMFGPSYEDQKWVRFLDPRAHRKSLKVPVFLSSCKHDFLKEHAVSANLDFVKEGIRHEFLFLEAEDRNVAHVHNVISMELAESKRVNESMVRFMEENA